MSFFKKPWNGYNPQSFNSVYSVDDLLWAVLLFLIFCEMKIVMSENKNLEQYRGNTCSPTRRHKGSSVLTLNSCPSLCTGQSWHPNLSLPSPQDWGTSLEKQGPTGDTPAACTLCREVAGKNSALLFKAFFSWRDIAHKHHLPTLQVGLSCI